MNSCVLAVLVCLVGVATCYPAPYWGGWPYYHHYAAPYYYWGAPAAPAAPYYHEAPTHYPRLIYYGVFSGDCAGSPDGLYYVDDYSFAYCSNGVKTLQPCAEGSANPAPSYFKSGGYYNFYDFCSVNLVAQGYTGHHAPAAPAYAAPAAPAYAAPAPAYPAPAYPPHEEGYEGGYEGGYEETNHYEQPKAAYEEKYYEKKTYEEKKSKDDHYEESAYPKKY